MEKNSRMNNKELSKTIELLKQATQDTGKALYAALADELDKSKRSRVAVNLSRIERYAREGEVVAVPGKVLASGSFTKPVTVAAFNFSEEAREKIHRAKGATMSLNELVESGVEPSKVRIMK